MSVGTWPSSARPSRFRRDRLVLMGQVHGDRICVIDGDEPPPECIPECDGLITARPGVALAIRTADCVPLFFVDRVRRVIGVAHAGWRGTALGMASRMVGAFVERFSSRVADILVAIGPAIGPCCYQVDAPVHAAFSSRTDAGGYLRPCREDDRWMLDLALANRLQIRSAGGAGGEYPLGRSLYGLPAGALLFAPRKPGPYRQTDQLPDAQG